MPLLAATGVALFLILRKQGYALCVSSEERSAPLLRVRRVRFPRSEDMKTFQQALHSHGKSPSLNMIVFWRKLFRSVRLVRSEPQCLQAGLGVDEVMGRSMRSFAFVVSIGRIEENSMVTKLLDVTR